MDVSINQDCIGCGLCESINSEVFHLSNKMASVNKSKISGNEGDCRLAAEQCPVNAIEVHE